MSTQVRWSRLRSLIRSRGRVWLAVLPAAMAVAYGQSEIPALSSGGQGEIAFQGSYQGAGAQPLLNITGATFHFQELLPGVGLLSGDLEGYNSQTRFDAGENFLQLRGAPWMGEYWTITGGDFRAPANLVEFPFNNIFNPEIQGRGFEVQAAHGDSQYTFFAGDQTLTAGLRVAYRIMTPQRVTGFSAVRKLAPHLQIGARALEFQASPQAILDNPFLFPTGRNLPLVRTLAVQSLYTPVKRLKIYVEGSRPMGDGSAVTSEFGGLAWDGSAFSWKADYTHQGILYFPLAGYFAGDRAGPFAEGHWRARRRLEFYGSANQYRNNLEHDNSLPALTSWGTSAGATGWLPQNLSASVNLSTIRFSEVGGGETAAMSNNSQIQASLARPLRRHTLHAQWSEILLGAAGGPQRQRSTEAGDSFQRKHFSLDGTLRYQQVSGSSQRNSIFFRGRAQAGWGRLSAYGNLEVGNDLANQTLFSTSAYRTSVVGVAWRVARGWNLQTEMFRNTLNLAINPQSIFLLENGALGGISPATASLSSMRQWQFYFRLSKQIRWGAGLPSENLAHGATQAAALVGTIEGVVRAKALAGNWNVSGIPVSLDGGRIAVTGADGRYSFDNVPEGAHEVALLLAELPADFDPGETHQANVAVEPRRTAHADFYVLPLASITGQVSGPEGVPLEDIVIRMAPGGRYTTTAKDGSFAFYNIREGDCVLALDTQTLPDGGVLISPASISFQLQAGNPPLPVGFKFSIRTRQKPIRRVLDLDTLSRK